MDTLISKALLKFWSIGRDKLFKEMELSFPQVQPITTAQLVTQFIYFCQISQKQEVHLWGKKSPSPWGLWVDKMCLSKSAWARYIIYHCFQIEISILQSPSVRMIRWSPQIQKLYPWPSSYLCSCSGSVFHTGFRQECRNGGFRFIRNGINFVQSLYNKNGIQMKML